MTARTTTALRALMLVVIAVVALANAIGWVDPDLWIPFVCIIAVMGVGTRGGVLDSMRFVLLEVAVVLILGIATFSGSRDFVWAASVAVSVLAVGKIALLEMHRADSQGARRGAGRPASSGAAPRPRLAHEGAERDDAIEPSAVRARAAVDGEPAPSASMDGSTDELEPAQPLGTVAASDAGHSREKGDASGTSDDPPSADDAAAPPAPRKRRERDDPTPVHRSSGPS